MAKAPNGPLGAAHGSLGNLTFYELNGQQVVRRKAEVNDDPSEAQLIVRSRMTTVMGFLKKLKPFIKTGFINESKGTTRSYFNVATSHNLNSSVKMEEGLCVMNYEKAKLSSGTALQPDQADAVLEENGLRFSWNTAQQMDWKTEMDQSMMMAFFPEEGEAIFETSGARRKVGFDTLALPPFLMDKTMELYLSFVSDDRLQVSNSLYLGRLN